MKKVLFLDIDGVLNSKRSFAAANADLMALIVAECTDPDEYAAATIDPIAVKLLNNILTSRDVFFILSSSHRTRFAQHKNSVELARNFLTKLGLESERLLGLTCTDVSGRGQQIQRWITENHEWIDTYVILDDCDDFLPHQLPHVVKVDNEVGISNNNYSQLLKML